MEKVYLHDIPFQEAWSRWVESLFEVNLWNALEAEEVDLEHALGRVTAEPVWARISSPHYHAAAMDGFALRALDVREARDKAPVKLRVGEQAQYVDTGDAMPPWADAVVPIEHVEFMGARQDPRRPEQIVVRSSVAPWAHVRPMGEDLVATELVLPAGQTLRPVDLGAIAASGHSTVRVHRRPLVAILPTGSELVPVSSEPEPGEILEYNSLVLAAQVESWGGVAVRSPIVPDDLQRLKEAILESARQHDLILVNAGSSAGSEDFTAQAVEELGKLLVHGIAVRPGHPVILGMVRRPDAAARATSRGPQREPSSGNELISLGAWAPLIGVPGYPVSAALTGEIFVEPMIAKWLGRPAHAPATVRATITRKVHSSAGDDEYLRVTVGRVGDRMVAAPLSRGAGVITSLVRADGIVLIPSGAQGLQAGEEVTVRLYRPPADIERSLVILGSHDLSIDLLAQELAQRGSRLVSANLGSLGGLIALQRGEAHLAGCHLLDPDSGEHNLPYIRKYLPGVAVVVLTLVEREQGLIFLPENPKGIRTLADLARPDVVFVNRQRGSGTRVLLDYHLQRVGVAAEQVNGYAQEEYSHLTLAAAVASGRADVGLGIRAAASALDLGFIGLFKERFDLVIPEYHHQDPRMAPLLAALHDVTFRQAVSALPGYDVRWMGTEVARIGDG